MAQQTKEKRPDLNEICWSDARRQNEGSKLKDEDERFVGLKIVDNIPTVYFPLGYSLSDDQDGKRKDILILLNVLKRTLNSESQAVNNHDQGVVDNFPLISYQRIILDFLTNGYYFEREATYKKSKKGKINWNRTIKKIHPVIQNDQAIYFDFIVKHSIVDSAAIITEIHKYCVYKSFVLLGWLYTDFMPSRPNYIGTDIEKYYSLILQKKLGITFNDNVRILINDMLNILNSGGSKSESGFIITWGTYRFEYPWQDMIASVFTCYNESYKKKKDYFPTSFWYIDGNGNEENSKLQPDTVMYKNKKLYILDAKYYKYGVTEDVNDLPATASIQKQITYGDYAVNKLQYRKNSVFNAFLIPRNCGNGNLKDFGYAYSTWQNEKSEAEAHKHIYGIFVDTKWLMKKFLDHDISIQNEMSDAIDDAVRKFENVKNQSLK